MRASDCPGAEVPPVAAAGRGKNLLALKATKE